MAEFTYTLGERELHFFYSVGARCDISEWIIRHGGLERVSADLLTVFQAVTMHKAYIAANKTNEKPITEEELRNLPAVELAKLSEAVDNQVRLDSGITVETEEVKTKNAKGAAKR